jgi:uncharacterized protein
MKIFNRPAGESTHTTLILESGERALASLRDHARAEDIRAAHFTAIGAFRDCTVAYFDWESRSYHEIEFAEQMEVLVLAGDIAWKDDEPVIHAHVVLGRRDGTTRGGHLREATVRPTLEVFLEQGGALSRRYDPESGLSLVDRQPLSEEAMEDASRPQRG